MKPTINIKSLSNEELEMFISKYGEVIKTKSFYTGWDKKKYHLSLQELLRVYGGEFDYTDKGKFRQKASEYTDYPEDVILTDLIFLIVKLFLEDYGYSFLFSFDKIKEKIIDKVIYYIMNY